MKNDWEQDFVRLDNFKAWLETLDNNKAYPYNGNLTVTFTVDGVEAQWRGLQLWWKKYSAPMKDERLIGSQGAKPDSEIWVRVRWMTSYTGQRPAWEGWTIEDLTFHGAGSRSAKVRDLAREYIYTLVVD